MRNLTELFGSGLTEAVQMSLLSIALRPHRANQQVSLWQYLQSDEVPADLDEMGSEDPVEYALTIPQVLFNEVKSIRCENITDGTARAEVAKQVRFYIGFSFSQTVLLRFFSKTSRNVARTLMHLI